ncbi:Bgt-2536 [Blumeria graminis f. sp. tritici]|uniref:Bgt-2536 n=2 Tax=Blumeria graminis f. sp. tritici TaxID=62690 RepID=A0A381L875_BLUGR|nr:integral membrane E3 ubiquitin ligase [Blumeria graminis f. sp. tritici 96224]VCU39203.1 Bgt-2536 [Blumeria graminis f. sp. tritici]
MIVTKIIGSWNWAINATQHFSSSSGLIHLVSRILENQSLLLPQTVEKAAKAPRLLASGIQDKINLFDSVAKITEVSETKDVLLATSKRHLESTTIVTGSRLTLGSARSFTIMFSYFTSKWALGAVITAIALNRTNVYARTRWNLNLSWKMRLIIRIPVIVLLSAHCRNILLSIQCQTSPDLAISPRGNMSHQLEKMFTQNGGFLYDLSTKLLLGVKGTNSCLSTGMAISEQDAGVDKSSLHDNITLNGFKGSLTLLWPLFKIFALSHFTETFSSAVQGRQQAGEFGISIFEHSLAFIEAEVMAGNELGNINFGLFRTYSSWTNSTNTNDHPLMLRKANVSLEVLLVSFISAMNHLTSHILAIFDMQACFRLLNTGTWGLAYISVIITSILSFSIHEATNQSLLRFPTVYLISFIPHILMLCGIFGCSLVYIIALTLTAFVPSVWVEAEEILPVSGRFFRERLTAAHQNMQANAFLSNIRLDLCMDFYTALLRIGFSIMTMASEAIYLNESRAISIKQRTWIEEDRLNEIEATGLEWPGMNFGTHVTNLSMTSSGYLNDNGQVRVKSLPETDRIRLFSGYACELTTKTQKHGENRQVRTSTADRNRKWYTTFEFWLNLSNLLLCCIASSLLWIMAKFGVQNQPRWLRRIIPTQNRKSNNVRVNTQFNVELLHPGLVGLDGKLEIVNETSLDVEEEYRRLSQKNKKNWTERDENDLEVNLYKWWLAGGWWGDNDNSGNYIPKPFDADEDKTSIASSTTDEDVAWESDGTDEGFHHSTPQKRYLSSKLSTTSIDSALTTSDLFQLINPKTLEQRAQTEILSTHLSTNEIVTRSRYKQIKQRSRTEVLTSTNIRPPNFVPSASSGKLSLEEEAQILEYLLITRRNASLQQKSFVWTRDSDQTNDAGPVCVICQSLPRCTITWPCRCISLCNDCRITLAMNNFDKCVCCRQQVIGFSRIFVP